MNDEEMREWGMKPALSQDDLEFIALANEFRDFQERYDNIKEKLSSLKDQLLTKVPEEIGDVVKDCGGIKLTVSRPENFEWDADIMQEIFSSDEELPKHITKRLVVYKKTFHKLSDEDKERLMPALTRKPGPAKLKVESAIV